ncbi:hypothetical protein ACCT04_07290 [Rhizobium ruizarguesonis]
MLKPVAKSRIACDAASDKGLRSLSLPRKHKTCRGVTDDPSAAVCVVVSSPESGLVSLADDGFQPIIAPMDAKSARRRRFKIDAFRSVECSQPPRLVAG